MTDNVPPARSTMQSALPAVTVGIVVLYGVMSVTASVTGSLRGEAGLAICGLVIVTALVVERVLFGTAPVRALSLLGLARMPSGGMLPALLITVPLVAYYPAIGLLAGSAVPLREQWPLTAVGVFLQGGVAEEVMWRGFLYRHLREARSFRNASIVTMIFMVVAHALLVLTLDPISAAAAILVSAVIVFPMCHVFELDRGAVWSVAFMHAVVQGIPKLFEVPPEIGPPSILGWAMMSTLVPLVVFVFRRGPETGPARSPG